MPIIGKGIPNQLRNFSEVITVSSSILPTTELAVQEYEHHVGGTLAYSSPFGNDLLKDKPDLLLLRDQHFASSVGGYDDIYSDVVSGEGRLLQYAITTFNSLTQRLTQLI